MNQLLQVRGGVEFWQCLCCGRVRRIFPRDMAALFSFPPEFCSTRCMERYMHSGHERSGPGSQMTFGELADCA